MAFRRAFLTSSVLATAPAVLYMKETFVKPNERTWPSFCDPDGMANKSSVEVNEITIVDDIEIDKAWESEKESCSFCNQFLRSPCKNDFRRWSQCVDKAKELDVDFIKACMKYTNLLMECTSENVEFFEKWKTEHEKDYDDDTNDDNREVVKTGDGQSSSRPNSLT